MPLERAAQRIGEDVGPQITDVGIIVDGRPATVDARGFPVRRHEALQAAGQAVEELERSGRGH